MIETLDTRQIKEALEDLRCRALIPSYFTDTLFEFLQEHEDIKERPKLRKIPANTGDEDS